VFTGCSDSMGCASLAPSQITVQTAAGSAVTVVADPSEDHMSVAGQPDLGRLSFVLSSAQVIRIELATTPAQPVIVLPSPGEEAHALAGWIVLTVASLLSLIATAIPLCYVLAWRLGFGTARMQAYPIPDAAPESPVWLPLATRELAASGLRRPAGPSVTRTFHGRDRPVMVNLSSRGPMGSAGFVAGGRGGAAWG
jgi:hypothetical protein